MTKYASWAGHAGKPAVAISTPEKSGYAALQSSRKCGWPCGSSNWTGIFSDA